MAQLFFTNGIPLAAGALLGSELIPADGALASEAITPQQIGLYTLSTLDQPNGQYAADSAVADFTATAPEVAGAKLTVLELNGVLAGDRSLTMPTAAALAAAISNVFVGFRYVLRFINSSAGAHKWTIVGNASVVVSGIADVAQATSRDYLVEFDGTLLNATLQSVGGGTS